MNLYYDFQVFVWQRYGGISRYFCELIRHLESLAPAGDFSVALFAGLHTSKLVMPSLSAGRTRVFAVKPRVPLSRHVARRINRRLFSIYMVRKHGIYHPTYYEYYLPRRRDLRRVVTVYDMTHELFPQFFSVRDPTARVKRIAIEKADVVICISENTRKDLLEILSISQDKVRVVHLGVTVPKSIDLRPAEGAPYILYVGERAGYKNFGCLLRAYGRNEQLRQNFHLACCGGPPFSRTEQEDIAALGLRSKVRRVVVSDVELNRLYAGAAAFVYPSLYEGFGLPLLEAMANRCPVVCSAAASMPEVVGNAGLYFDPNSDEQLSFQLESLLTSDDERKRVVHLGRERARLFTWNRCAEKTLQVYQTLLP